VEKSKKPREWWISRAEDFGPGSGDYIYKQEPFGTHSSMAIHVIEKSAYDKVVKAFKTMMIELEFHEEHRGPTATGLSNLPEYNQILKELGE